MSLSNDEPFNPFSSPQAYDEHGGPGSPGHQGLSRPVLFLVVPVLCGALAAALGALATLAATTTAVWGIDVSNQSNAPPKFIMIFILTFMIGAAGLLPGCLMGVFVALGAHRQKRVRHAFTVALSLLVGAACMALIGCGVGLVTLMMYTMDENPTDSQYQTFLLLPGSFGAVAGLVYTGLWIWYVRRLGAV